MDARHGRLAALALLTAALAGCGPAHAASARPRPAAVTAAPSGRCARSGTNGTITLTVPIGGRARTARLHRPRGYPGQRPVPLVLNLHGSGSTAAQQETISGMDRSADQHGFLVAYPQGLRRTGSGYSWNIPGTPAWQPHGPDESAYLRALVTTVSDRYCVDPRRVFGTGFSGGAREISVLACAQPRLFAAVAAVGGLRAPQPCPGGPVPVLGVHGTADAQNPYPGHGQPYWTYSVPEAARRWAVHDGCAATPAVGSVRGGTLTAYPRCPGGAVELYTLPGKGHGWPADRPGGFATDEVIWEFFAAHPLSGGRGGARQAA